MKRLSLTVALLLAGWSSLHACTVFFVYDGKKALAGDNEDWKDGRTQIWFVPPKGFEHGIVYLGFGVGEYPEGGIRHPKITIPKEGVAGIETEAIFGFPQLGMNERGLFFGGAATDMVRNHNPQKKPRLQGFFFDRVLRECGTVAEAMKLIERHDVAMPQGQILLGDASGASVIVEAGNVVLRQEAGYQVITNFRRSQRKPDEIDCPRYLGVDGRLKSRPSATVNLCRDLLQQASSRDLTQYSSVLDLKARELHLYHKANFDKPVVLRLADELPKGARAMKVADLFKK
jgi:hypothetical protein